MALNEKALPRYFSGSSDPGTVVNGAFYYREDTGVLSMGNAGILIPIANAGIIAVISNIAPNSSSLSAGQCQMWFDPTNGSAKLMVKAKQADGTVLSGFITLS